MPLRAKISLGSLQKKIFFYIIMAHKQQRKRASRRRRRLRKALEEKDRRAIRTTYNRRRGGRSRMMRFARSSDMVPVLARVDEKNVRLFENSLKFPPVQAAPGLKSHYYLNMHTLPGRGGEDVSVRVPKHVIVVKFNRIGCLAFANKETTLSHLKFLSRPWWPARVDYSLTSLGNNTLANPGIYFPGDHISNHNLYFGIKEADGAAPGDKDFGIYLTADAAASEAEYKPIDFYVNKNAVGKAAKALVDVNYEFAKEAAKTKGLMAMIAGAMRPSASEIDVDKGGPIPLSTILQIIHRLDRGKCVPRATILYIFSCDQIVNKDLPILMKLAAYAKLRFIYIKNYLNRPFLRSSPPMMIGCSAGRLDEFSFNDPGKTEGGEIFSKEGVKVGDVDSGRTCYGACRWRLRPKNQRKGKKWCWIQMKDGNLGLTQCNPWTRGAAATASRRPSRIQRRLLELAAVDRHMHRADRRSRRAFSGDYHVHLDEAPWRRAKIKAQTKKHKKKKTKKKTKKHTEKHTEKQTISERMKSIAKLAGFGDAPRDKYLA